MVCYGCSGMFWYVMVCYGIMVWNGMEWNGMAWNGMECNAMLCYVNYVCMYVFASAEHRHNRGMHPQTQTLLQAKATACLCLREENQMRSRTIFGICRIHRCSSLEGYRGIMTFCCFMLFDCVVAVSVRMSGDEEVINSFVWTLFCI